MIAIIDEVTGAIERIALTTEGLDLTGKVTMEVPEGYDPIAASHIVVGGDWVPNAESALARLRATRDQKLLECDWTQLADVPSETRDAWQPYRQALRDMPETADPFDPEWPNPPA